MGINDSVLEKMGFKFGKNGAHSARSMMLDELKVLFLSSSPEATLDNYHSDIVTHNLLDKPTSRSRSLTYRHLVDLYSLNNQVPLYRVFRKLWPLDPDAQPLLALQFALLRDPLLRLSIKTITDKSVGSSVVRADIEQVLSAPDPDRFRETSLKSFAQNINGSWTQAGFLQGRNKKTRSQPVVTPVNMVFALFIGHLEGASGERLLQSSYCKLFGLTEHHVNELAIAAGHRGLIDFKQSGGVTDVRFTDYLTSEEEAWIYE